MNRQAWCHGWAKPPLQVAAPDHLAGANGSHTGRFLRELLNRRATVKAKRGGGGGAKRVAAE